jgi:hypothetical protein
MRRTRGDTGLFRLLELADRVWPAREVFFREAAALVPVPAALFAGFGDFAGADAPWAEVEAEEEVGEEGKAGGA